MGGRSALAAVILALTAAPAAADDQGPKLTVGGTLLRVDGATVEAEPLTVRPTASDPDGIRSLEVTVDGRRVRALHSGGWRIDPVDGSPRVVITATDGAGNVSTEQADVRFTHATPQPPRTIAARSHAPGETVANVGDADGDGIEDVLIGDPGTTSRGSAGTASRARGREPRSPPGATSTATASATC